MRGAWVSRARLHAADGSPMPTKHTSSSALGARGVELSLNAIRAGALMAVEKPGAPGTPGFGERRSQFLALAKAMSEVKVVRRWAGGQRVARVPEGKAPGRRRSPPGWWRSPDPPVGRRRCIAC